LAEVEALVAELEASGLKRAVFCRQRDLALRTLDKYRHRMHGGRQSRGRSFVPVEVVPSTAVVNDVVKLQNITERTQPHVCRLHIVEGIGIWI
jgi:hypothetical protein